MAVSADIGDPAGLLTRILLIEVIIITNISFHEREFN
jgi:hypothetical protein